MTVWRKQQEHIRTVVSNHAESCCGIREIKNYQSDPRESPGYTVVFFRDDKVYPVYFNTESAEILFDLLGIEREEFVK